MSRTLTVFTDLVCPFCLLAEGTTKRVASSEGVSIVYAPFELRPRPTPTLRPEDPYLPSIWNRAVYPMASQLGVPIQLPTVSPQPYTDTAFEVYQFARTHGKGNEFIEAGLRAFFQQDRDIGKADVLADIAAHVGLDKEEVKKVLEERTYKEIHEKEGNKAAQMGITGVPAFVMDGRMMSGVPSEDGLRRFVRGE